MKHKLIIGILIAALAVTGTSTAWLVLQYGDYQQLEKDSEQQRLMLCRSGKAWIDRIDRELKEKGDEAHTQVSMLFGTSTLLVMDVFTVCMPQEEHLVLRKITDFRTALGVGRNSSVARQELADLRERLLKYL